MHCQTLYDTEGRAIGIACGARGSLPACSTPGCRRRGRLSCDHPVTREPNRPPEDGDSRLHRTHGVTFYVWSYDAQTELVSIALTPPPTVIGARFKRAQTVTLADWYAKADATCDRPVCERCAVTVGRDLHHCPAHARAAL
jgi:hypothetical protein